MKHENFVFSMDNWIAWLATKPADAKYDFVSTTNCALCQYLKEHGFEDVRGGSFSGIRWKGNPNNNRPGDYDLMYKSLLPPTTEDTDVYERFSDVHKRAIELRAQQKSGVDV